MAGLIVADASAIIGYLDDNDAHHAEAVARLIAVEGFIIHPITLGEVLVHPVQSGTVDRVTTTLNAIGMVESDVQFDGLRLAELRAATRLKMPDCIVLATALRHQVDVLTFDDRLVSAAAERR